MKKLINKFWQKIFFKSSNYWDKRYSLGGNSGSGSYNQIAKYKAEILNDFIIQNSIKKLIDFGCGDGNQIAYLMVEEYLGLDVSPTAIEICNQKFKQDLTKQFRLYTKKNIEEILTNSKTELAISLDVIYHLVEDKILFQYLNDLFNATSKYTIIFSTNFDKIYESPHQKDRKIAAIIQEYFTEWDLMKFIENPFKGEDSMADFFIYKKRLSENYFHTNIKTDFYSYREKNIICRIY